MRSRRAIAAHSPWQPFEERSGRTLEELTECLRVVSRNYNDELIALSRLLANDDQDSLRLCGGYLAEYILEPLPGKPDHRTTSGGENERQKGDRKKAG